jgi:hypothetical protein
MNLKRCLTVVAGVMFTASLAYGLHPRLSLEEIAQNADLIFVGTVTRQNSHYNDRRTAIETDVTFTDVRIEHESERAQQRGANTIRLTYAGGRVGNVIFGVSDSPSFETGRRYLVFMIDDESRPFNPVVGAFQGMFEVIADPVTGLEYLRTPGRRAVIGVDQAGNVRSTARPLERISAGVAAFATSTAPLVATAPDPEPVEPGSAIEPRVQRVVDAELETPMTIDAFVDHVRNVSLKKKVDNPKLARRGTGTFYRTVNDAIVAEPIKESVLQVETIDEKLRRAGLSASETSLIAAGTGAAATTSAWYEPLMNCGRRQFWPFTMEVPASGKEFFAAYDGMNVYNNYVDLFRPIGAFPGWGLNGANEFLGYPSNAQLVAAYGFGMGGALAMTYSLAAGPPSEWCGTILEADIAWNPSYSWTGSYFTSLDSSLYNVNFVTMHELGHTVGLSRAGALEGGENYSYPYLTHMHAAPNVTEDGLGLHAADAINLRANYGTTTNIADMGVESYFEESGSAHTSWLTSPGPDYKVYSLRTPLRPGDTLTANQLTVENLSQFAHNNVHVRLYLSTDRTITGLDRQFGDWLWPTFWGDSYWEGDLTANVPLDTPPGTYYVGARVSINGYQNDGYAGNNATFIDNEDWGSLLTITCDGMFAFSPASTSVLKGGLDSAITLSTLGTACPWTATSSDQSWLHVTTASGTGPATVAYRADANLTSSPRSASIAAGGTSHTVSQEAGCVVSSATTMSVWKTVSGTLSTANCLSSQRNLSSLRPYAARYSFSGTAGKPIVLALDGNFNTYVYLLGPSGAIVAEDDNGATFGNSRIPAVSGVLMLPTTGIYTIEVTSASVGATGTFNLSLMSSVTLTISPDPVAGSCKDAKGKIVLGTAAPVGGAILTLSKWPSLAAANMPATFTVPAGAASKTFTITTSAVAANQTGNITASWGTAGDAYGTDSLTIRPIQPLSLALSPTSVNEGSSSTATVTLECAAPPGGITLTLSSSKPLRAQPASPTLTIPAGSTSGTFLVDTFDVSVASTASIKATANGKAKSQTLTITPIF